MAYRRVAWRNPWLNREGEHIVGIVIGRTILAAILVFALWNPTGYSYVDYAIAALWGDPPEWHIILLVVVGIALGVGAVIGGARMLQRLYRRTFVICVVLFLLIFIALQLVAQWDFSGAGEALKWIGLLALITIVSLGFSHPELKNFYERLKGPRR